MSRYVFFAVWVAAAIVCGCAKKKPAEPVESAAQMFSRVENLVLQGQVDAGVSELRKALHKDAYRRDRSRILERTLELLLSAGRVEEAEQAYLAEVGDPMLAGASLGTLYSYHVRIGNPTALANWTTKLVAAPLPLSLLERAFGWHLDALMDASRTEDALACVPVILERFSGDASRSMLNRLKGWLMNRKDLPSMVRLLEAIRQAAPADPGVRRFAGIFGVELAAMQQKWAEAESLFATEWSGLEDSELGWLVNRQANLAREHGNLAFGERICRAVLDSQESRPVARFFAANAWLGLMGAAGDAARLTRELGGMFRSGMPPRQILDLYRKHLYFILEKGDVATQKDFASLGESLLPALDQEADREAVRVMLLDLLFAVEDCDRALAVLGDGVPEKSKEWNQMARAKLLAHQALKAGKTEQAVLHFREFMEVVRAGNEPEEDPTTGLRYTREMILGLNALRIADIQAAAGMKEAALTAYGEASTYYSHALADFGEKSREADLIRGEMEKINAHMTQALKIPDAGTDAKVPVEEAPAKPAAP